MKKDIPSVCALLLAARDFIDAIPPLALLNAPRRSGRMLVAKIDEFLSAEPWHEAPADVIADARARWQQDYGIRIDHDTVMLADAHGLWVNAWLLLPWPTCSINVEAFSRALNGLPMMAREVYRLHRIEGRGLSEVAKHLGLTAHEAEALIFTALRGLHAFIHDGAT